VLKVLKVLKVLRVLTVLKVLAVLMVLAVGVGAVQQVATRREPQFENDQVRVWKSIIMPNQPLSMHRHEHGRTIVALVGGTLKIVEESGPSRSVTWETGKAYWLGPDPPGTRHADVNESDKPIEVIVVEMKR
jgi:quercetin dioxygenase-like cupin family protein